MKPLTSGHLVNNGGIRAHSAGEFYPFRVVAQGTFDNLKWHVVWPDGSYTVCSYHRVQDACNKARLLFSIWRA